MDGNNQTFIAKDETNDKAPGVGSWVLAILITFIPVVNVIFLLYWSLSDKTLPARRNWAIAMLIWMIIIIIIACIAVTVYLRSFYH